MGPDWQPSGDLNITGQSAVTILKQGMCERGHHPTDFDEAQRTSAVMLGEIHHP